MYINPERMTTEQMARIDRWLAANGCTDHVSADDPVIVRGNTAEYVSLGRGSRTRNDRVKVVDGCLVTERRKLRIRTQLRHVA